MRTEEHDGEQKAKGGGRQPGELAIDVAVGEGLVWPTVVGDGNALRPKAVAICSGWTYEPCDQLISPAASLPLTSRDNISGGRI